MEFLKKYAVVMLLQAAVLFGCLISCNKIDDIDTYDDVVQPSRVNVLDSVIAIDVSGTSEFTIVTLNGIYTNWSVSSSEDWCTVEKGTTTENGKEENTIAVNAAENTYYERTAVITIVLTNGDNEHEKTIKVVQESGLEEPKVTPEYSVLNLPADAENKTILIETNQDTWVANTTAEWIAISSNQNQLTLSIDDNRDAEARTAAIKLIAGKEPYIDTAEIIINQAKPDDENNITIEGIEMILVKAGTFNMGAQKDDPSEPNYFVSAAANQGPVHEVTISKDFYIGKFELTQAQFEAIMGYNPSATVGPNHPVEMVDWNLANEFITKLNQKTGKHFRLPTEAEWEFAARGGNESKGYIYSGSDFPDEVAYYFQTDGHQRDKAVTVPVGSYEPNELGIYDMSGNVYEWCSDFLENYSNNLVTDPVGNGTNTILRGGSWYHNNLSQTVSYRGSNTKDFARAYLGFRVVYIP